MKLSSVSQLISLSLKSAESDNHDMLNSNSLLPFPRQGLKLSYILSHFYELCGDRSGLIGKTTADVNEFYQKKITESSRVSYCEYLKLNNEHHPAVGKAAVFISHAWKYEFLEVMDALKNHFQM